MESFRGGITLSIFLLSFVSCLLSKNGNIVLFPLLLLFPSIQTYKVPPFSLYLRDSLHMKFCSTSHCHSNFLDFVSMTGWWPIFCVECYDCWNIFSLEWMDLPSCWVTREIPCIYRVCAAWEGISALSLSLKFQKRA